MFQDILHDNKTVEAVLKHIFEKPPAVVSKNLTVILPQVLDLIIKDPNPNSVLPIDFIIVVRNLTFAVVTDKLNRAIEVELGLPLNTIHKSTIVASPNLKEYIVTGYSDRKLFSVNTKSFVLKYPKQEIDDNYLTICGAVWTSVYNGTSEAVKYVFADEVGYYKGELFCSEFGYSKTPAWAGWFAEYKRSRRANRGRNLTVNIEGGKRGGTDHNLKEIFYIAGFLNTSEDIKELISNLQNALANLEKQRPSLCFLLFGGLNNRIVRVVSEKHVDTQCIDDLKYLFSAQSVEVGTKSGIFKIYFRNISREFI